MQTKLPKSIKLAVYGVYIQVAIQVLAIILFIINQNEIVANLNNVYKGPTGSKQQFIDSIKYGSTINHAIIGILLLWFAVKLYQGRKWPRLALTVLLTIIIIIVFALSLPPLFKIFPSNLRLGVDVVQVISVIIAIATLIELWIPGNSREWFNKLGDK